MGNLFSTNTEPVEKPNTKLFRTLSIERPKHMPVESFSSYYDSRWFVPILVRRGVHETLCNASLYINANIILHSDVRYEVTFDVNKNVLRHVLRQCEKLKIALQFDFETHNLQKIIQQIDPTKDAEELAHANMLFVHSDENGELHVEHFEPHGSRFMGDSPIVSAASKFAKLEKTLKSAYDEIIKRLPNIITDSSSNTYSSVQYYPPNHVCPFTDGPQTQQEKYSSTLNYDGYCKTWSWAWVDLRMQYPEIPPNELMSRILKLNGPELHDFIMDYAYYAQRLYHHYSKSGKDEFSIYSKTAQEILDYLEIKIPSIEKNAGTASQQVIDSILQVLNNVPNSRSMLNFKSIVKSILQSNPDKWGKIPNIMYFLLNKYITKQIARKIHELTRPIYNSTMFSTVEIIDYLKETPMVIVSERTLRRVV